MATRFARQGLVRVTGIDLGVAVVVDAVDQQLVDAVQKVAPAAGQRAPQLRVVRRHPQRPRLHCGAQRLQSLAGWSPFVVFKMQVSWIYQFATSHIFLKMDVDRLIVDDGRVCIHNSQPPGPPQRQAACGAFLGVFKDMYMDADM